MAEYSQGVCQDGAAILKDGELMTPDEIVAELKGLQRRQLETAMLNGILQSDNEKLMDGMMPEHLTRLVYGVLKGTHDILPKAS